MPNRLSSETSPYLLQHQDNPVEWYPWGEEAFEKAKSENKPVFLSVGYSSCHWCHVMAHESFESDEVAKVLNDNFICVKVDREERPDIDEAYMTFVQLSSGRGGWPMSVFLTPDKKPFFGGTYWPKDDRDNHFGFMTICARLADAWKSKKADIIESGEKYATALGEARGTRAPNTFTKLDGALIRQGIQVQAQSFDSEFGGFGGAPKFPPHTAIEMLTAYVYADDAELEVREAALGMVLFTLQRMALGGIHDHVGGGFHRYSTDREWLVPHFEKMLYDNALLLTNFSRAAAMAHSVEPQLESLFVSAASGIVNWLEREMTAPEGYFYSALDADSEGEEGKFYVWTKAEIDAVLGEESGRFCAIYGVTEEGNFLDEATQQRTGSNILHLKEDQGDQFDAHLHKLLEARTPRTHPGLDNKALIGWNGLMIGALADAGILNLAERAAMALLEAEARFGELPHQIAQGVISGKGFLEDYAYFIDGLIKIARFRSFIESNQGTEVPGPITAEEWVGQAIRLKERMVELFYDDEQGGFYGTSDNHEFLFGKTKPVFDQPAPSANAIAIRSLTALGDHERAMKSVQSLVGWMERAPQATEAIYLSAMPYVQLEEAAPEVAKPISTEVSIHLDKKELVADASGKATFNVLFSIPEGVHLNSFDPPARWLTATQVVVKPLEAKVDYPLGENYAYTGNLTIPFTVSLPKGESGAEFEVKVSYQPCTDSECLLPSEKTLSGVIVR